MRSCSGGPLLCQQFSPVYQTIFSSFAQPSAAWVAMNQELCCLWPAPEYLVPCWVPESVIVTVTKPTPCRWRSLQIHSTQSPSLRSRVEISLNPLHSLVRPTIIIVLVGDVGKCPTVKRLTFSVVVFGSVFLMINNLTLTSCQALVSLVWNIMTLKQEALVFSLPGVLSWTP